MRKKLLLLLVFLSITSSSRVIPVKNMENITIAFGSCYSQRVKKGNPSKIFNHILKTQPDLWIWLGDAAYVDDRIFIEPFKYQGDESVKQSFEKVKNLDEYKALRDAMPIIGVWDDHDYGINDGDKTFNKKDVVRNLYLDFLDEPKDSNRRTNPGGLYESYYIGDPSKVKVILLDVRYQRDPKKNGKDMLGEIQWKWLEEELKTNTAEYIIVGSGTQMVPADRLLPEYWFPESLERFLDLIRKYKKSRVVLISGDIHYAEIMKYPCNDRVGYEIYEVTSSGMTHVGPEFLPFFEGIIKKTVSNTYNEPEDRFVGKNFGLMEFRFGNDGGINFDIRDNNGIRVLEKFISRSELEFDVSRLSKKTDCILDKPLKERVWINIKKLFWKGEPYLFIEIGMILLVIVILSLPFWILLMIAIWAVKKIIRNRKQKRE